MMNASVMVMCGVVLFTVVGIAYGGSFLLRVRAGQVGVNEYQAASFRAGHAHAGVLVTLGLVVQLLLAQPAVPVWASGIGTGVLWSAILIPLGFFLSVLGKNPSKRNAWKYSIGVGAASLTIGLVGAGVGLVIAGTQ